MEPFLKARGIPYAVPNSTEFNSLQSSYSGSHADAQPAVTTLPETPEQVATIVKQCIAADAQFVVRGGGHDIFGRFTVAGAVSLDLRNLNHVTVSEDKKTARIGGGITALQLLRELRDHGLQAPVGACGDVGHTSWCLVGGLGPYIHSYGLGADQIVGARVTNSSGDLVDADERLLKGLRGGGGSLGVVAELAIKTYPLQEIQGGLVIFESSDLETAAFTFFTNYSKLLEQGPIPSQLYPIPYVLNIAGLGRVLACGFFWNGPASDASRSWIDRIADLAPLMPGVPKPHEAISPTDIYSFGTQVTSLLPKEVSGTAETVVVSHLSPPVIAAVARLSARLPANTQALFTMHILRPDCPSFSADAPDSVCPFREPQVILEIVGAGLDESSARLAVEWANEARDDVVKLDDALGRTYFALTSPENLDLQAIYGDMLEELRSIKREYDPKGVFKNTVPRLV